MYIRVWWSGAGRFVLALIFVCILIGILLRRLLLRLLFTVEPISRVLRDPVTGTFFTGLILAVIILWPLGRFLNGGHAGATLTKLTKREILIGQRHTFYSIPMQYWAIPLLVIAFLLLIGKQ